MYVSLLLPRKNKINEFKKHKSLRGSSYFKIYPYSFFGPTTTIFIYVLSILWRCPSGGGWVNIYIEYILVASYCLYKFPTKQISHPNYKKQKKKKKKKRNNQTIIIKNPRRRSINLIKST